MAKIEHKCAWCGNLISVEENEDESTDMETHTMCTECELKQLEESTIPTMEEKLPKLKVNGLEHLVAKVESLLEEKRARVKELKEMLLKEPVEDKNASFLLSKRAAYEDDWIKILEHDLNKLYPTNTNLPQISGINFPAIYYLVSRLESNNRTDVIGDSGNSFGKTQVHGPYFMRYLARDPRTAALTGLTSDELKNMANTWLGTRKSLKSVWKKVPVDQSVAQQYMSDRGAVLRRKEGLTIRRSPTGDPGIIKKRGGEFVGYVINLDKLKTAGLNLTPNVMSQLHSITSNFITWGVARSAVSKLFITQSNSVAYAKFNRAFNSRNIKSNKGLQSVLDSISQSDFSSKIRMLISNVNKYGYDTNAPNAYNIYQLAFISNASGAGRVQQFLRDRKPFYGGNLHYIQSSRFKKAMNWISRDPKMAADVKAIAASLMKPLPSNSGLGGFTSRRASNIASLVKKATEEEFRNEVTNTKSFKNPTFIRIEQFFMNKMQELMNESNTVMNRVWNMLRDRSTNPDISAEEISRLIREDIANYIFTNFENLKDNYRDTEYFKKYMRDNWHIDVQTISQEEVGLDVGEMDYEGEDTKPEVPWNPDVLKLYEKWVMEFAKLMENADWAKKIVKKINTVYVEKFGTTLKSRQELLTIISKDMSEYIIKNLNSMIKEMNADPNYYPFVEYMLKQWDISPESLMRPASNSFSISKRAVDATVGVLYFPEQYAESIKSGKRRMTIRANDVPVKVGELVRCVTYSGGIICDVKIIEKSVMSITRIRKAYGEKMADSLLDKFGKEDKRFVIIKFQTTDAINAVDDSAENNYNSGGFGKLYTSDMEEPFTDAIIDFPPIQNTTPTIDYMPNYTTIANRDFVLSKKASQTYSYNDLSYSVDMLMEITSKNKTENIPLSVLEWNMEEEIWSKTDKSKKHSPKNAVENPKKHKEDTDRINDADLSYPILVYKNQIVDGYHRLAKAVVQNKKNIKAKVITDKQMDAARTDKERIKELSKKALMLVPFTFNKNEYEKVYNVLKNKFTVSTMSVYKTASDGDFTLLTKTIDSSADYDLLFVIGGSKIKELSLNKNAQELITSFVKQDKPIAFVSNAVLLASETGVTKNLKVTGSYDVVGKLRRSEAVYTGMPIEKDGMIFTAIGSDEAENLAVIISELNFNKSKPLIKNASEFLNSIWKLSSDESELAKLLEEQRQDEEQGEEQGEEQDEEQDPFAVEVDMEKIKEQQEATRLEEEKRKEMEKRKRLPPKLFDEDEVPVDEVPKEKIELQKPDFLSFEDMVRKEDEDFDIFEEGELKEGDEILSGNFEKEFAVFFNDDENVAKKEGSLNKEEEEEGEDYDINAQKSPKTIYGFRLQAPKDKKGEILDRWHEPGEVRVPRMSPRAQELFSLENLKDGKSMTDLFRNQEAFDILSEEPHLLQSWILPALLTNIGERWFRNNSVRARLGNEATKTPFRLFDDNDVELIHSGVRFEDLPSAKVYIRMINQLVTDITNSFFSERLMTSKEQGSIPIGGYIYKSLNRAMTKEIAAMRGYKEVRYPVCAVCKAKQKDSKILLKKMEPVPKENENDKKEVQRWKCVACEFAHTENEDELKKIDGKIKKLKKDILTTQSEITRAEAVVEDFDEERKPHELAKIEADREKVHSSKVSLFLVEKERSELAKATKIFANQIGVPYWHAWCPNDTCPGNKVPLTSVNWDAGIWKNDINGELAAKFHKRFRIKNPNIQEADEENVVPFQDRKLGSAHIPPDWMLDIEFICPHDDTHFTLRNSKYKGSRNLGGFLWEPFRTIEWEGQKEFSLTGKEGPSVSESDVEQKVDDKMANALSAYLAVLGRKIFSKEAESKRMEFEKWLQGAFKQFGGNMKKIINHPTTTAKLREISLYKTVKETSTINPHTFVSWLTEASIAVKLTEDQQKDLGKENIFSTNRTQREEEIYVPILQNWTDRMLSEKNGFKLFNMEKMLTNRKLDGIPSDGPGTFFVTKIKSGKKGMEFGCDLYLKSKFGESPINETTDEDSLLSVQDTRVFRGGPSGSSSKHPRMLKVIGMWKLSDKQVEELKSQVRKSKSSSIVRNIGLEKLDTETHLEKDDVLVKYFLSHPDENLVGDIEAHDFRTAVINQEDTYLGIDDYVLVQTLLMPGLYHWDPIDKVRNLRRHSDTGKQIFSRIGSIMLDKDLRSENRLMLQEFVNNIKKSGETPEKMELILEDFISKIEQSKKKASFSMSIRASKDPLSTYKKKREFDKTEEPEGKIEDKNKYRFVIQRHIADKAGEHFDLRLENDDGTMTSWALPKHKLPSGKERLLAVKTEDHPISYNKFHGTIPKDEYGAGEVEIYDSGTYEEFYRSGNKIVFKFKGKKESGTFKIFKTDGNKWLIMQGKKEDTEKN